MGQWTGSTTWDRYNHLQPRAQTDASDNLGEDLEADVLTGESGEPRWNRTINPQFKSSTGRCPPDAALYVC